MQITLKTYLLLVTLVVSIVALSFTRIELARKQLKLDEIERLLPHHSVEVDLLFETERTSSTRTLRYPGGEVDRGCMLSIDTTTDGVTHPGTTFCAWFVGDIELIAGFGAGRDETSGHLIALQISACDDQTGEALNTRTEYVVYNGREVEGFRSEGVSVTLKPSAD